jgi:hypothetical protein
MPQRSMVRGMEQVAHPQYDDRHKRESQEASAAIAQANRECRHNCKGAKQCANPPD